MRLDENMVIDFINKVIEEMVQNDIQFKELIQDNNYYVSDIVDYSQFTNNSAECDYQECAVQCAITPPNKDISKVTYNINIKQFESYAINYVKNSIVDLFESHFIWKLEDIIDYANTSTNNTINFILASDMMEHIKKMETNNSKIYTNIRLYLTGIFTKFNNVTDDLSTCLIIHFELLLLLLLLLLLIVYIGISKELIVIESLIS
jgi:hypothetical protein